MPNADEDALRAIRAASTALQERWPLQLLNPGNELMRDLFLLVGSQVDVLAQLIR